MPATGIGQRLISGEASHLVANIALRSLVAFDIRRLIDL